MSMFGLPLFMMRYMGSGAGTPPFNPYGDDDEIGMGPIPFDQEEARKRARRSSSSALVGGLLEAYLNRGEGIGRAFELQRHAFDTSMDRSQQDYERQVNEARQRQADRENAEYRRAQISNIDVDNRRQESESRARAEEAARKKATEEAERARIEAMRAELVKSDPRAARWSDKQIEEAYGPQDAPRPTEVSPGGYLVDPKTGKVIYHAPERPKEHGGGETPAQARAAANAIQAQVKRRTNELMDEWKANTNPHLINPQKEAQARIEARQRAEAEVRGEGGGRSEGKAASSAATPPKDDPKPSSLAALLTSPAMAAHADRLHASGMSWSDIEAALKAKLKH